MKLRKLARQLAAAAVAGAMALSLCMPALAETWDMSNTEKYPNGKGSWISVYRNPFHHVQRASSGRRNICP